MRERSEVQKDTLKKLALVFCSLRPPHTRWFHAERGDTETRVFTHNIEFGLKMTDSVPSLMLKTPRDASALLSHSLEGKEGLFFVRHVVFPASLIFLCPPSLILVRSIESRTWQLADPVSVLARVKRQ